MDLELSNTKDLDQSNIIDGESAPSVNLSVEMSSDDPAKEVTQITDEESQRIELNKEDSTIEVTKSQDKIVSPQDLNSEENILETQHGLEENIGIENEEDTMKVDKAFDKDLDDENVKELKTSDNKVLDIDFILGFPEIDIEKDDEIVENVDMKGKEEIIKGDEGSELSISVSMKENGIENKVTISDISEVDVNINFDQNIENKTEKDVLNFESKDEVEKNDTHELQVGIDLNLSNSISNNIGEMKDNTDIDINIKSEEATAVEISNIEIDNNLKGINEGIEVKVDISAIETGINLENAPDNELENNKSLDIDKFPQIKKEELNVDAQIIDKDIEVGLSLLGLSVQIENDSNIQVNFCDGQSMKIELENNGNENELNKNNEIVNIDENFGLQIDIDNDEILINNKSNIEFSSIQENEGICINEEANNEDFPILEKKREIPDIHINIIMDEISKKAVFKIDMPYSWNKLVVNEEDEYSQFKIPEILENASVTSNNEMNLNQLRKKERLDIQITMFLGQKDLEDSILYASINSKKLKDKGMPKDEENINLDLNIDSMPETLVKNPEVLVEYPYKSPNEEVNLDGSKENDNAIFHLGKFEFPSFGGKQKPEIDIDENNSNVHVNIEPKPKRPDFRFQLPKIEFPSFNAESKPSDSNPELVTNKIDDEIDPAQPSTDDNVDSPVKRFDFRYKLPTIEFPSFNDLFKSPEADADIKNSLEAEGNLDVPNKRYDFRYKFPKIEFPSLSKELPNDNIDGRRNKNIIEIYLYNSIYPVGDDLNIDDDDDKKYFINHEHRNPDIHVDVQINTSHKYKDTDLSVHNDDISIENDIPKSDFRFQLPKIDLPFFGTKPKSSNDAHFDIDINKSDNSLDSNMKSIDSNLNPDIPPKRYDFRYKLPTIEIPYFGVKGNPSNPDTHFDIDIDKSDLNKNMDIKDEDDESHVDSPPKRYDFRFQLPKIDFPSFQSQSSVDEKKLDLDINSDISVDKKEKINTPDIDTRLDINVKDEDLIIESPPKRYDFRFQLPKIELPLFHSQSDSVDGKLHDEIDNKDSDIKVNIKGNIITDDPKSKIHEKPDFRFQLPKIELPLFREKPEYENADVDKNTNVSVDMKVKFVENDPNVESSTKRHDFRFQLPPISLPSLDSKPKSHNAVADIDIDGNVSNINADLDSPTKRYDFRFKLPTVELPIFGGKTEPETNKLHVNEEIKLKSADNIENVDEPNKRYDFRYQLPSFSFSFDKSLNSDDKINVDLPISDNDKKIKENLDEDYVDNPEGKEVSLEIIQKSSDNDLYIDGDTRRYDFTFSFPETKFICSDGIVQFSKHNTGDNANNTKFSILFDGGDSDTSNIFEIKLEDGSLSCSEYFDTKWQPEINSTVMCTSPKKNVLVVLLYSGDSRVVILFNEEVMLKYNLKGCISTLHSFDVEGAKLNSVKLRDF